MNQKFFGTAAFIAGAIAIVSVPAQAQQKYEGAD